MLKFLVYIEISAPYFSNRCISKKWNENTYEIVCTFWKKVVVREKKIYYTTSKSLILIALGPPGLLAMKNPELGRSLNFFLKRVTANFWKRYNYLDYTFFWVYGNKNLLMSVIILHTFMDNTLLHVNSIFPCEQNVFPVKTIIGCLIIGN